MASDLWINALSGGAVFAALRDLTATEKEAHSAAICEALRAFPPYREAGTILSYIPYKNEPDIAPLMWKDDGMEWGFSVVESDDTLTFYTVEKPENQLRVGKFRNSGAGCRFV